MVGTAPLRNFLDPPLPSPPSARQYSPLPGKRSCDNGS